MLTARTFTWTSHNCFCPCIVIAIANGIWQIPGSLFHPNLFALVSLFSLPNIVIHNHCYSPHLTDEWPELHRHSVPIQDDTASKFYHCDSSKTVQPLRTWDQSCLEPLLSDRECACFRNKIVPDRWDSFCPESRDCSRERRAWRLHETDRE